MTRRRALGIGVFVALLALAGCSSVLGPSPVDQDALTQNETYDWNSASGVNASINVTGGEYEAVYAVDNQSRFVVRTRDSLGREQPLPISALKFRYPDGRVVTASSPGLNATNQKKRTVISLPARNGQLGFEAPAQGKRFATRTFVPGTYEVTIPRGMRVTYEPLAHVTPSGYGTERTSSGHVRIHWENVESNTVSVRYYLARDLYIFAGIAVVAVLVALVGALYYLRQIRTLERRRRDASPNEGDGPGR